MPSQWQAVGSETDPLRRARELQRSWERLLADGALAGEVPPGATAGLRPIVVESWRRSLATGLDPTDTLPPIEADESEMLERWYEHPLGSLTHVLTEQLRNVAEESRSVVVVTDASGLVLHRMGDERLKELSAEQNHLVEGARWSEAADGTNGIGTALAGDHAFQVFAFEHFNERHHQWICSGAPVHDPVSGRSIGLIDLSSLWKVAHPRSLELVITAARTIEQCLLDVRRDQDARLRRRYGDLVTRSTDLLVNRDGYALEGPERVHSKPLDVPEGGGEVILDDGAAAEAEPLGQGEAYLLRRVTTHHARSAPVEVLERSERHVRELVTEQSALRHVATLVARESAPDQLFAAVAEQVARVFAVPLVRLVRFEPEGSIVVGGFSAGDSEPFAIGSRWPRYSTGAIATVRQTGRPARMEDYGHLSGEIAGVFRTAGVHSAVASPIVVEGRLWGAMVIHAARHESFPESTEARLTDFTELVATAIANAESRAAVSRLADEHAALQRVATLVAQGASPASLFAAVAEEVGRLLPVGSATMGRYEAEDSVTTVASWSATAPAFPIGKRWPMMRTNVAWLVLRTGQAARLDDFSAATDPIGVAARELGAKSAVASPIVVDGNLWGLITVTSTEEPLPPDTEARLASFTELVATAIADTEAREALARLADEQAALRRVAVLVAQQPSPREVFAAVTQAVGLLLDADVAALHVFSDNGTATTIAGWSGDGGPIMPIGSQLPADGNGLSARIFESGSPARIDNYAEVEGEAAELARSLHLHSSVGAPILVDGKLWGVLRAANRGVEPWAENAETRIAAFTELVATAIANAESREALAQLADEQAALRRVATLVAEGVRQETLFAAVADEVAGLVGVDQLTIDRYDADSSTVIASLIPAFPLGSRWPFEGSSLGRTVFETGRPARYDDYSELTSTAADVIRSLGFTSTVGAPIIVEGRMWGVICVAASARPLPADTEGRLVQFTELVATAIANAEGRSKLAESEARALELAREQAALRRVATLVAQGTAPAEIFAAVSAEVDHVFRLDPATGDIAVVNRFGEGPDHVVVGVSKSVEGVPIGSRWRPDELFVGTHVHRTGRSARIRAEDVVSAGGDVAEFLRRYGYRSQVASPIVVDGRLWGAMSVNTADDPPQDTEERLARFTELVATAIANTDSREALRTLADEQATLRGLATLIAQEAVLEAVFAKVVEDAARTLGDVDSALWRDDGDRTMTAVAVRGTSDDALGVRVGTRLDLDGDSVIARVLRAGQPQRIEDFSPLAGSVAGRARQPGMRSAIGCPIIVGSRTWGVMTVATYGVVPFAPETETRLARFGDLVGTAIANAESRDALARLADEQAALRRVATLVARAAPPGEVFDAVAKEVGKLLDADVTVVGRYDADGAATAIGSWSSSPGGVPVGTRSAVGGRNVLTFVAETRRPARVDGYDEGSGEAADIARQHGWRSSIAAPISVEGRVWGVMLVATKRPDPFPAGAEERLSAFTDLVATSLANAQAQDELRRYADEQASLQRVATLVAQGMSPTAIFSAASQEVEALFTADAAAVVRFEHDPPAMITVGTSDNIRSSAIGMRSELVEGYASTGVFKTGRSARVEAQEGEVLDGPMYPHAQIVVTGDSLRIKSAVASPLVVEGKLWGAMAVWASRSLTLDTEARLERFTDIVATAIANADSREALAALAAEQAALRHIATHVAQGRRPEEIFSVVAEEVAAAMGAMAAVARFDDEGRSVVITGVSEEIGVPIGRRLELSDGMAGAEVYRTGRPARVDGYDWSTRGGPVAEAARRLGVVSQVATPIVVEGHLWGTITALGRDRLAEDAEQRMERFTELLATAIANAESKHELEASLRRIVSAGDEARRRIERDLHDGIQQRLITLSFRARAMTRRPPDELPALAAELSEGLRDASDELREISRGIHPTILTEAGLGPALRALARRSDIPVDVDVRLDERLPTPVEAAAYYIASEALTNVAKHARANVVELIAAHDDGVLTLQIRDDGVGGVDAGRGSGILGLTDRVEALGGTISIASPPHGGTTLSVRLLTT